jgi:acyl-CoA reductase-like NAD-dependent aldehyde dehydrogenase
MDPTQITHCELVRHGDPSDDPHSNLSYSTFISIFLLKYYTSSNSLVSMISHDRSSCDTRTQVDVLRLSYTAGKLKTISYRRNEISRLYRRLRNDCESVCNAIASDGRCSAPAAEAEFRLTMDGIRQFHSSLKLPLERKKPQCFAHDDLNRRSAVGLVAIRPGRHSRLYSTLIPLTAAIAAGNCILLEARFFIR